MSNIYAVSWTGLTKSGSLLSLSPDGINCATSQICGTLNCREGVILPLLHPLGTHPQLLFVTSALFVFYASMRCRSTMMLYRFGICW